MLLQQHGTSQSQAVESGGSILTTNVDIIAGISRDREGEVSNEVCEQ